MENCRYYVFTKTMKNILGTIFLYYICVNNLDFSHKLCMLTLRRYALYSQILSSINANHCFCSMAKLCPTLCDPMEYNMPGFPVFNYLPEFVPTTVHWISDAIQPSHPLLSPSPSAYDLSQHQGLSQWIGSLHLDGQRTRASVST